MSNIIEQKDSITIVECKWNKSGQEMERMEVSVQCDGIDKANNIVKEIIKNWERRTHSQS